MTTTETFTTDTDWEVPEGVDVVTVELLGEAGETGGEPGGNGGRVVGELPVTPGETLYIRPSNGGGTGIFDGGDAADIRQGGSTLTDRVAVAAGGGGSGRTTSSSYNAGQGGAGGPDTGEDGTDGEAGFGGPGGTQNSGGNADTGTGGSDGTFGNGGDSQDGGAGGAGWYGGAGGGDGEAPDGLRTSGGGGGGSNYDDDLSTVTANERGTSTRAFGDGGQVELTYLLDPEEPENVTLAVEDDDTSTVTWGAPTSGGEVADYEVELSTDGGAFTSVATTTNLTHTETVATSVDSIQFRVRASNDSGVSDWVTTATETTNADGLTVVDTREEEIDLSWDDPSANDGTDVLLAESSGTVAGDYTVAQSLTAPEGSTTLTGLENGETYYARVQATYTGGDQTPAPVSNEVSTTTEPVPPTLDALDASTIGEITLTYTLLDNSTDGNVEIERSDDRGQTWTTIATVDDLQQTEYTDTTADPGNYYTYRLTRNTDHASVSSNTLTDYAATGASQEFVVARPGDTIQLPPDELAAIDFSLVHTGVGDGRVTTPENDDLIEPTQRHNRVNYYVDGDVVFSGYAVGFQGDQLSGEWTLRVDGVGSRLEETRPDYDALGEALVYTNTRLDDAIRDYWARTPFDADVTDQVPELVAEDEELQSADTTGEWDAVDATADTAPFVVQNGNFEVAQSSFTEEAEDNDRGSASTDASLSNFSNGAGLVFISSGDNAEWDFSVDYTIPENDVSVYVRVGATTDAPELTISLGGDSWTPIPDGLGIASTGWYDLAADPLGVGESYSGGDLSGSQTLGIEATTAGDVTIDVVAPLDNRFTYTFDNDNGGNSGYLDGPQHFPDEADATLQAITTAYNIPSATITTTFNDISGAQAIAVSNDNGANYLESANTETDTFNFNTSGRQAVTRFTLGRYGSRTGATPLEGHQGQVIQDYTLEVDLNDLVVIDRLELSRDHFANLKTLHDYGGFIWTIEHDDGDLSDLTVRSFMRGQETREAPYAFLNPANRQPEVAAENYFNSVYLEGALQDDGTRPTAEVQDVPANEREITPGVLRDQNISTESGAQFRANALLQSALENNELRGTIDTHPTYVSPGFAYEINFGQGADFKTLESLSITESAGDLSATAEFVTREQLSQTISSLKQEGRNLGNQV